MGIKSIIDDETLNPITTVDFLSSLTIASIQVNLLGQHST